MSKLSRAEKEVKNCLDALHKAAEFSLSNIPRCYVHCEQIGEETVRLSVASPYVVLSITTLKEYLYCYVRDYYNYQLPDVDQFAFLPSLDRITKDTPFFLPDCFNILNWKSVIPPSFTNARIDKPLFDASDILDAARIWKKAVGKPLGAPDLWNDHRSIAIWVYEENFIGIKPLLEDDIVMNIGRTLSQVCGCEIFETEVLFRELLPVEPEPEDD